MARKTLMILGAGVFQAPAIEAAARLGYRTVAVSYDANDVGRELADEFIHCSTVDRAAVLGHARSLQIDGITTMASEVSAVTAAFVAETMGLPGYTTKMAVSIANKVELRRFLKANGFPVQGFCGVRTLDQALGCFEKLTKPAFLKPSSASGSRGAFLLHTADDLKASFARSVEASILEKEAILEEMLAGREIGGEVLIKDGEVVFFQPTRKLLNAHFVPYGHILPAGLPEEDASNVRTLIASVVRKLGLRDGPLNFDVMLTPDGPRIIELGGRLGGNCLPELMRLHTGVNTVEAVIRIAMGDTFEAHAETSHPVGVFIFGAWRGGQVAKVHRLQEKFPQWANDVLSEKIVARVGQRVEPFNQGSHQLGYYVMTAKDEETLNERILALQAEEWVELR